MNIMSELYRLRLYLTVILNLFWLQLPTWKSGRLYTEWKMELGSIKHGLRPVNGN